MRVAFFEREPCRPALNDLAHVRSSFQEVLLDRALEEVHSFTRVSELVVVQQLLTHECIAAQSALEGR